MKAFYSLLFTELKTKELKNSLGKITYVKQRETNTIEMNKKMEEREREREWKTNDEHKEVSITIMYN